MRISDWSSDVCSSDLLDRLPLMAPPCLLLTGAADLPDFRLIAQFIESAVPQLRRVDYDHAGHLLNLERPCELATETIGRASCRERVCQYVYISVVAVSFKKKYKTEKKYI